MEMHEQKKQGFTYCLFCHHSHIFTGDRSRFQRVPRPHSKANATLRQVNVSSSFIILFKQADSTFASLIYLLCCKAFSVKAGFLHSIQQPESY